MTTPENASGEACPAAPVNFIRARVAEDLSCGKNGGRVMTRFPPEPNGDQIGRASWRERG